MPNFNCADAYNVCKEECGKIPKSSNPNDPDFEKWMKCIDDCFDRWAKCVTKDLNNILGKLSKAKTMRKKAQLLASIHESEFLPKEMRSQFRKLSFLLDKSPGRKK